MSKLGQLRADLRAVLLTGGDTSGIRAAIVQAEADQRIDTERQAQQAAEAKAAEAEHIRSTAETIAAAAVTRLAAVLEPLTPPPAPHVAAGA